MQSSDLKFFAVIGVLAVASYCYLMGMFEGKTWNLKTRPERTITFVPPGTPGAITMEEFSRRTTTP